MTKTKTMTKSCLGFQTTEELAREIETLVKSLPKDQAYSYRKKNTSVETSFEPGERASIDVITTDSVDREKEVVIPDGIDLDAYRRNPIVLFSHDDEKIIGKSQWIKPTINGIKSKTQYAYRPDDFQGDFLPDLVYALVRQDILKGRSIGFIPTVIDEPTAEQVKARPDWSEARLIISKSMLFEYSVVAVPCNEDALQQIVSKGLKEFSTKSLEALGIKVEAPTVAPIEAKRIQPVKLKAKPIDENKLVIKMMEQIQIDPDAIARRVIEALKNRGRV